MQMLVTSRRVRKCRVGLEGLLNIHVYELGRHTLVVSNWSYTLPIEKIMNNYLGGSNTEKWCSSGKQALYHVE